MTDVQMTTGRKAGIAVMFGVGAVSVGTVATLSAIILRYTLIATIQNLQHVATTGGKVWLSSKYRDMEL